jgi:hypothetical protein
MLSQKWIAVIAIVALLLAVIALKKVNALETENFRPGVPGYPGGNPQPSEPIPRPSSPPKTIDCSTGHPEPCDFSSEGLWCNCPDGKCVCVKKWF